MSEEPICVHCNQPLETHVPVERPGQAKPYFICPFGLLIKGNTKLNEESYSGSTRQPKYLPIDSTDGFIISNPMSGQPLAFKVNGDKRLYLLTVYEALTNEPVIQKVPLIVKPS